MIKTAAMMWITVAAMAPAAVIHIYLFGGQALLTLLTAVSAAVITEALCLRWREQPALRVTGGGLGDGSAVICGVIIALSLPAATAWFVPASASLFAIVLAKHCYGGLGNNPFNPAMAGYALAYLSFPTEFGGWEGLPADAHSSPTPLAASHLSLPVAEAAWLPPLSAALGGGCLLALRIADWRLPIAFLLGAAAAYLAFGEALTAMLYGGLIFTAFFVVTDPVTAATTKGGRWLSAALIGVFAVWLRLKSDHTDALAFAVLLGNLLAPLCDRLWRWR